MNLRCLAGHLWWPSPSVRSTGEGSWRKECLREGCGRAEHGGLVDQAGIVEAETLISIARRERPEDPRVQETPSFL